MTLCQGQEPIKVGVEAAVHYHRTARWRSGSWPTGWEVLELSPARVSEQRRVQGRRRVKTDAIDLEAITELVLAGSWCSGDSLGRRRSPSSQQRWVMQRQAAGC